MTPEETTRVFALVAKFRDAADSGNADAEHEAACDMADWLDVLADRDKGIHQSYI